MSCASGVSLAFSALYHRTNVLTSRVSTCWTRRLMAVPLSAWKQLPFLLLRQSSCDDAVSSRAASSTIVVLASPVLE